MKNILTLLFTLAIAFGATAQTIADLQGQKASLETELASAQAIADELKGRIGGLDEEIKKLQGWRTGLNGLVGFNFQQSDNWAGNGDNATASTRALNLGLTAHANKLTEKYFWRNKMIWNKTMQDVDLVEGEDDGLFDSSSNLNDLLNISSLFGYQIHKYIAASVLGEFNSSVINFMEPGTFDFGAGFTWTPPINDLVVVVHPLNYRYTWIAPDIAGESAGGLGAKIRADYNRKFNLAGKAIAWSSTFTSFLPYQGAEEGQPSAQEYTWLNSVGFDLWNGIGVGINFGIRESAFESSELQSFYGVGLSYGFAY